MRRTFKITLIAGVIAAIGGVIYIAGEALWDKGNAVGPPTSAPPPSVPVAEALSRTLAPTAEFTGFLAAPETVELRSRVGGTLEAVSVPEGHLVNRGQLLFQIDPRPFQVALDTAVAQLRQAEALARQAQADFDRIQRLVASGAVSRKNFDDAIATRNARQAQAQSAKAAVAAARLELSWTRITAPIAGRVDRMWVTRGNLVSGGVAGNATLLTTIVSHNPIYVYFDIDEATWLKAVRQPRSDKNPPVVNMGLTTDNGLPYQGVLDFVGNQMNRSTGTIRARAVIPNSEGMLSPGLFARISLPTGEPRETLLIDDLAVSADQGKNYVLVVGKENQAEYRQVELGQMVDGLRVITQGLQPGEKIILKGLVRPGMIVAPRLVPMQQNVADKQTAASTKADSDSASKAVRQ
ncbi:efflux RND transporter periplasmic adaptor subunit [Salmonella enterica]|uniref:Efflux RND transporter periplasmic adaptor subunit n=1 Tax=Salmonella enterica subsp. VII serovar 40:z4,z24:[z39] TaxID=1967625 RepID=A0A731XVL0_SALEE|nr:efflux RND transporter periplasmic adaptor subunit [Salmonella enterica]EDO5298072.1 efflux RND transporter periplasmic adaptor subunit [Salmonella enterica subsp. houtenae serovar 40:z4,z24:-]EDT6886266.1 efflux RND transporter periplasmic adaptor subunit [Salmonella enterica subsp. enterica]QUZ22586.1 efflux RND transporter periplasmic adaptor subunit [Salmonella enterica subsp. VII str. CFSAN000554]HAE4734071.1 efflux RND transporter periplasmic adaptor subunit [Salmonella enterica subsp.